MDIPNQELHRIATLDEDSVAADWVSLEVAKSYDLIDGIYYELKIAY